MKSSFVLFEGHVLPTPLFCHAATLNPQSAHAQTCHWSVPGPWDLAGRLAVGLHMCCIFCTCAEMSWVLASNMPETCGMSVYAQELIHFLLGCLRQKSQGAVLEIFHMHRQAVGSSSFYCQGLELFLCMHRMQLLYITLALART